jgi:prepilin-type N-terminal cleavage/methylation domain-containing protein/prepilin-type processing-associated H-X9-DG protein
MRMPESPVEKCGGGISSLLSSSSSSSNPAQHRGRGRARRRGGRAKLDYQTGSEQNSPARANVRRNVRCAPLYSAPGFSLIELLIVLALLIVLSTMYFGFSSPSHQRNEQKNCGQNLQKLFLALEIYANDSAGRFPEAAGAKTSEVPLELLVPRYTADTAIFICPGSKDSPLPPGESLTKRKISYAYYMGRRSGGTPSALMSDAQVNAESKSVGDPVFSTTGRPPGNNHHIYGGNILFSDGHVELSQTQASFSLVFTQGVVLLNPKP